MAAFRLYGWWPALLWAALAPAAGASSHAVPQQDKQEEFYQQFLTAARVRDSGEMDNLLRRFKESSIEIFVIRCDARAIDPHDELNLFVDSFVEAWDRVYRSGFARNYDRYLQRLDAQRRPARSKILRELLPALNQQHILAAQSRKPADWEPVRKDAEIFLQGIVDCGDLYFQAFGYNIKGNAWNPALTEEGGDAAKSLEAYEAFLAARDKLGLTVDRGYTEVKATAASLRADLGIPDPETGVVAEKKVSPYEVLPVEGSDWLEVPLEAGVEKQPGAVEHPSDLCDEHRLTWQVTSLGAVDSETQLPGVEPPVKLRRVERNAFVLDGGAALSAPFKLSPKPELVVYQRKHESGSVTEHALLLATGIDRDPFVGVELNLQPTDQHVTVFFRSVALRSAKTPYGPLSVYDLDSDGKFGYGAIRQTGAVGLPQDFFVYRFDAVTLGSAKHSLPFSPWISDAKGNWYQIEVGDFAVADKLKLRPVKVNAGEVKVEAKGYKGVKPVSLVFQSQVKETKGLVVDLMAGKGGKVAVPAGSYAFVQGVLQGEKGDEALIFPPEAGAWTFAVESGQETVVTLGAPFHLRVASRLEGKNLVVDGKSLHVVGVAGERYLRLVNAPLFGAEVQVKGGAKPEEMKGGTLEQINQDWMHGFYPQDVVFHVREGEKPPVRVSFKKHPWFGNLESDWLE